MEVFRVIVALSLLVVAVLSIIHVNAVIGIIMLAVCGIVTWLGHLVDNTRRTW